MNQKSSESVEQICLFRWAEWQAGKYPELRWLFHIPNGGLRSKATAGRLKAEGVKAGVPDLFLPVPHQGYHGLFIEMKREKGGKPSENQKEWLKQLNEAGYLAVICHGWEAAAQELTRYLETDELIKYLK